MAQVRISFKDGRPRQEIDVYSEKGVVATVLDGALRVTYLQEGADDQIVLATWPADEVEDVVTTIWTSTDVG